MDFSLTEEQRLFQSADKSLLRICPLERVRTCADKPNEFADDIWTGLCNLGVPGAVVSEAFGGMGLGVLDAALIGEILGKHVVPSPFLGPAVLAPLALTMAGSERQKAELLPQVATGGLRIAVGVSEHTAGIRPGAGVDCRNGRLFGRSLFVVDHVGAHKFLIADKAGNLYLIDRQVPGLEALTLDTVDRTRTTAMLNFNGVEAEPLRSQRGEGLGRLAQVARLILAADMLGAAQKMLDQAVAYAKIRANSIVRSGASRPSSTCARKWPQNWSRVARFFGMRVMLSINIFQMRR